MVPSPQAGLKPVKKTWAFGTTKISRTGYGGCLFKSPTTLIPQQGSFYSPPSFPPSHPRHSRRNGNPEPFLPFNLMRVYRNGPGGRSTRPPGACWLTQPSWRLIRALDSRCGENDGLALVGMWGSSCGAKVGMRAGRDSVRSRVTLYARFARYIRVTRAARSLQ